MNNDIGTVIIVDGKPVAWFADFTEEAREWCAENFFGRWLGWKAKAPEPVRLTPEEFARTEKEAAEMAAKMKLFPEDE